MKKIGGSYGFEASSDYSQKALAGAISFGFGDDSSDAETGDIIDVALEALLILDARVQRKTLFSKLLFQGRAQGPEGDLEGSGLGSHSGCFHDEIMRCIVGPSTLRTMAPLLIQAATSLAVDLANSGLSTQEAKAVPGCLGSSAT